MLFISSLIHLSNESNTNNRYQFQHYPKPRNKDCREKPAGCRALKARLAQRPKEARARHRFLKRQQRTCNEKPGRCPKNSQTKGRFFALPLQAI